MQRYQPQPVRDTKLLIIHDNNDYIELGKRMIETTQSDGPFNLKLTWRRLVPKQKTKFMSEIMIIPFKHAGY